MEALADTCCVGFIIFALVIWLGIDITKQTLREIRKAFNW